jgi:hypothetical protein
MYQEAAREIDNRLRAFSESLKLKTDEDEAQDTNQVCSIATKTA